MRDLYLAIKKWISIFSLAFFFITGLMFTYDALIGDGKIPDPVFIGINTPESKIVNKYSVVSHEDYFDSLSDSLFIMDKVVPHVGLWLRDQWESGDLVFERDESSRWAYYDFLTRKLHVSVSLLNKTNGFKVAILSHEWRHSRQNYGKWGRRLFSCMFGFDDESILENDAYMYQYLVEKEMDVRF